MPELPEVETVARGLKPLEQKMLKKITINDSRVWYQSDFSPESLKNQNLLEVSRRGKYLILRFPEKKSLLIHLRMTGKILPSDSLAIPEMIKRDPQKKTQLRCEFHFEHASYIFYDTRRFGTLTAVNDEGQYFAKKKIAPDLLSDSQESLSVFLAKIKSQKRSIKAVLLDQSIIAGVGNIYADEGLFASNIHPAKIANSVKDPEKLWDTIFSIMNRALKKGGTTILNYVSADGSRGKFADHLLVYGKAGMPCKVCGQEIQVMELAGRSTHFCVKCQKK